MTRKEKEEYLALLEEQHQREQQHNYTDLHYFVENMVHIEDRDIQGLAIPFKLWDGQRKALADFKEYRFNVVLKARQLGLTWLGLSYSLHMMLNHEGFQTIALSRTEDDSKELIRRTEFIIRYLPKWLISESKEGCESIYKYTVTASTLSIIGKGEESKLVSKPASANSGRSLTANLVLIDEWAFQQFAEQIYTALYPTINRPTGGQIIGISTAKRATLFEDIWTKAEAMKNKFNTIFLSWRTDPRRDEAWYQQTYDNIGEAMTRQEYPNTPEEAFEASQGLYFDKFNRDIHVVDPFPIPKHWDKYITLDYGLDKLAVLWITVDEQGHNYIYKELYQSDLIISEAAQAILEVTETDDIIMTYAPPDLWSRQRETGKTTASLYMDNGVYLTKSDNNRVMGWFALKELIKPYETRNIETGETYITSSTKFFSTCRNIIRTLPQLQVNAKNPNDTANEPHELTHAPDALRGFAIMRQGVSDPPEEKLDYEEMKLYDDYEELEEEGFY